jgi:hypothetical protein
MFTDNERIVPLITQMVIEIHKPELQALIQERMKTGVFQSIEDALIQALQKSREHYAKSEIRTGADLVAVMRASPYNEIELEPLGICLPIRDTGF